MKFQVCLSVLLVLSRGCPAIASTPETYRDLNHNGRLDAYEDAAQPTEARLDDLLTQMTLEEKVGTIMHGSLPAGDELGHGGVTYDLAKVETMIGEAHLNSFITRLVVAPRQLAEQNNAIQHLAEASRLGVPVTISTDPRSHFQAVLGASTAAGGFSLWPETLGLAATNDPDLVRHFGDVARREYRAVGIHMALSSQADLASEPRWPRERPPSVPTRPQCRVWCRPMSKGSRAAPRACARTGSRPSSNTGSAKAPSWTASTDTTSTAGSHGSTMRASPSMSPPSTEPSPPRSRASCRPIRSWRGSHSTACRWSPSRPGSTNTC